MSDICHARKRLSVVLCTQLFLLLFFIAQATALGAKDATFRILITNDDGIDSEGIEALVRELKSAADIIVVAPRDNKSGSSHSTTISRGFTKVTPYVKKGVLFGYAVDGTPADAVRFGILEVGKGKRIDLVISGINRGPNVGSVAHFSGTIGAAMEAVFHNLPAIAVSQAHGVDFSVSARHTAHLVSQIRKRGIPRGVVLSINIPSGKIKGAAVAPMGGSMIQFKGYEKVRTTEDVLNYRSIINIVQLEEKDTDTSAFQNNFITITPLKFDWTDYEVLADIKGWELTLDGGQ